MANIKSSNRTTAFWSITDTPNIKVKSKTPIILLWSSRVVCVRMAWNFMQPKLPQPILLSNARSLLQRESESSHHLSSQIRYKGALSKLDSSSLNRMAWWQCSKILHRSFTSLNQCPASAKNIGINRRLDVSDIRQHFQEFHSVWVMKDPAVVLK